MIKLTEILQDVIAEKKLCPKGKAYYNRRRAAGEKPSAYLSGRAVKVCKGLMEEGSEDEAWELVGQKDPNISKIVKNAGFKYDEESVNKLIPIIEKTPTTNISPSQVTKLKNFNNKSGEESLITDIIKISKSQNPRQGYIDLMTKRDSNDSNRQRGYDIGSLYDQITTGNYEPPVLIDINGTLYVVGGRTRLYASLVANKNIKVKILNSDKLINLDESLRDWFKKEDWVRIDTAGNITGPCGTMKKGNKTTRCLPRAKANSLSKAERAATSKKKAASDKQFVPNTKKAKVKLKEGLEDTSWTNDKDQTITLQQLLDAIKDYPIVQAPIEKIEKIIIKKDTGGIESDRLSAADVKYPIIIVTDDSGNYRYILDGNHRANKAIDAGLKSIPAKLVNISNLPQEFQDVLGEAFFIGEDDIDNVECKKCGWKWKLSSGGENPYLCHKCDYDNSYAYNDSIDEYDVENADDIKEFVEFMREYTQQLNEADCDCLLEAEYQGRTVPLGKPMRGDSKKFKVYVKNPKTGKVVKVNFGAKGMNIKKNNPVRRRAFRARHNCANPGPRTKARYWSCRKW